MRVICVQVSIVIVFFESSSLYSSVFAVSIYSINVVGYS